jgi:hypothetical protein
MATTTNYSWTTPDDTDLVKDGASAIRSLGTAIDSTVFTNAGNAVQKSTIDAKGDLLVGTADNTLGRLAVGTNDYVLTADSNETSGLKWAAASGGDLILITRSSFSDVATAELSNVFTSTYKSYLMVIENCYTNTGSQNTLLRLKYSTTTLTTNYYGANQNWDFTSTNTTLNSSDATSITLFGHTTSTYMGAANIFFTGVGNTSERFRLWGTSVNQQTLKVGLFGATTNTAENYGSVLLFAASGNITANVAIYGLGI